VYNSKGWWITKHTVQSITFTDCFIIYTGDPHSVANKVKYEFVTVLIND